MVDRGCRDLGVNIFDGCIVSVAYSTHDVIVYFSFTKQIVAVDPFAVRVHVFYWDWRHCGQIDFVIRVKIPIFGSSAIRFMGGRKGHSQHEGLCALGARAVA